MGENHNKSRKAFIMKSPYILGGLHLFLGLVSDAVEELSKNINQSLGFTDYNSNELITSSADTAGMLILSKTGRNWLMTNLPAEEFPLNITSEVLKVVRFF